MQAVAALAALAVVAGCGGPSRTDGSPSEQAQQTVLDFYEAMSDKDGETACSLLTDGYRSGDYDVTEDGTVVRTCEELLTGGGPEGVDGKTIADYAVDGAKDRLKWFEDSQVAITGGGEVAKVDGDQGATVGLRRVDGEWRIDSEGR